LYRGINARWKRQELLILGQNFKKAFDVKFANAEEGKQYVWGPHGGFQLD
jgi:hypothetical protein